MKQPNLLPCFSIFLMFNLATSQHRLNSTDWPKIELVKYDTAKLTSLVLNIFASSCCESPMAEYEDFLHGRKILLGQWIHQLDVPVNVLLLDAAQDSLKHVHKNVLKFFLMVTRHSGKYILAAN